MKSTKVCRLCKLEKSVEEFYEHKETADKLRSECKSCWNNQTLEYYKKYKPSIIEKRKDFHFRKNYGLSKKDVEDLKEAQNLLCLICNCELPLVVDHDHKTGKIRGLLCNLCNQGLGSFKDNPEVLRKAALYLERI